jgi:hypothetical protein
MRISFRRSGIAAALLPALAMVGALALLATCSQPSTSTSDATAPPTDAQREAGMAAEQLAALGGPANPATRALYDGEFEASGSLDDVGSGEGAWELRLLTDYAQFVRPGLGQDGGLPGEREFHEHGMRVVAGPLTITLMAQTCALPNGVSLPYAASVLFEGVAYQGCARRGVSAGEASTWASVLPDLLPAIDACLGRVTSRPGRVTTASALDEGQVSVRIREADGSRRDCVVDAAGSAVSVYDPVSDVDRRNGEGDPEFQRGASAPRAGRCQTVAEAKDTAGAHLGWLIRRGPCSTAPTTNPG